MATIVYVDAALQTGLNNGTSWENAYRGCAGLQTALDNVVSGSDTIIYIRNTFSVGAYGSTIDIDVSGGDYANNHWLKLIGCDSVTGAPLPKGQYVTLDGENSLAGHIVKVFNVHMVHIENVHFTRASVSGKAGCYLSATGIRYGFNFINCKFSSCDYGLFPSSGNNRNLLINRCMFLSNTTYDLFSLASSSIIIGSHFRSACQAVFVVSGGIVQGCIFESLRNSGIVISVNGHGLFRGETIVTNCTFYCTGTGGITAINCNSLVGPVITNNIIYLAQPASDIPVSVPRISHEDYNCTNATVNLLTGSHSLNAVNPQFVDATGGDFRPKNPVVLRGGVPDIAGNPTQVGAVQGKFQFISKAKITNLGRLSIFR